MVKEEKRICTWCHKPMGNSWNKSANGNYIHKKCVDNFKSYFKSTPRKKRIRELRKRILKIVYKTFHHQYKNQEGLPIVPVSEVWDVWKDMDKLLNTKNSKEVKK